MVSIGLLFLSSVSPAIFLWLSRHFSQQQKVVHALLFGLTCFYELAFVTFPTYYSVVTGFDLESEIFVKSEDLAIVLIGHALFVVVFLLGFTPMKGRRIRVNVVNYEHGMGVQTPQEKIFSTILLGIGLVILIDMVFSPPLEYAAIKYHAEIKHHQHVINMLLYWFRGAFDYSPLVVACYVIAERSYGRHIRTAGIAVASLTLIYGMIIGYRGSISRVLLLLLPFGILKKNRNLIVVVGILSILAISMFNFLRSEMRVEIYRNLQYASPIDKLKFMGQSLIDGMLGKKERVGYSFKLLEDLADRAQDGRNSVFLYKLYNQGCGAGAKPLLSALYFPIPRIIWPEKRPPGSMGKTNYESAMHLVQIGRGAPYYEMGPFLASAHAYWEGGWLWLIFAGFITGVFWKVILDWADAKNKFVDMVVALTFASALMTNGTVTCLHPLYAFFPTFISKVIPILAISTILNFLYSLRPQKLRNDRQVTPNYV